VFVSTSQLSKQEYFSAMDQLYPTGVYDRNSQGFPFCFDYEGEGVELSGFLVYFDSNILNAWADTIITYVFDRKMRSRIPACSSYAALIFVWVRLNTGLLVRLALVCWRFKWCIGIQNMPALILLLATWLIMFLALHKDGLLTVAIIFEDWEC